MNSADWLTQKYVEALGADVAIFGMNFDLLYEHVIYPDFGIVLEERASLGFDTDGKKVFGEFDPIANTAYIDADLAPEVNDPRRVFTLFHEVAGHGVLQGEWIRSEFDRVRTVGRVTTTEDMLDPRTTNILEWQANLFAAHVAAPTWLLAHWMQHRLHLHRPVCFTGRGEYCVDIAGHTSLYFADTIDDVYRRLASCLKPFFGGLSVEALSYRVAETGWAVDMSKGQFRLRRTARQSHASAAI